MLFYSEVSADAIIVGPICNLTFNLKTSVPSDIDSVIRWFGKSKSLKTNTFHANVLNSKVE